MSLVLAGQPLSVALALHHSHQARRRASSRLRQHVHCAAGGDDRSEPGPSGRNAAPELPPSLKQVPYRAIAGLASLGFANTAYLTATKLLHVSPACPLSSAMGGGCSDILSSEYASLFGAIPLSAVGMLAYGGMAALAIVGWRHSVAQHAPLHQASSAAAASSADPAQDQTAAADSQGSLEPTAAQLQAEAPFRTGVLAGGLVLASCSAYLLYILFTKFQGETCPYCLASAATSFSIAALAASGLRSRELEEAAAPSAGVVAATLLLLSVGLGNPDGSFASGGYDLDYSLPTVTTSSPPGAVDLAQRLRNAGAKMYGAFWCSHCYDQKQTFGAEAMAAFPYVECYPEGLHKDTKLAEVCQAAPGGLQGFPTWVMPGGEQLVGEQSFEQLEAALAKAQAAAAAAAVDVAGAAS